MEAQHQLAGSLTRCVRSVRDQSLPAEALVGQSPQSILVELQEIPEELLNELLEILRGHGHASQLFSRWVYLGRERFPIDATDFAKWAVHRARTVGPDQASRETLAFVAHGAATLVDYLVLANLSVSAVIDLGHGVRLMPYRDVPTEGGKVRLQDERIRLRMGGGSMGAPVQDNAAVLARSYESVVVGDESRTISHARSVLFDASRALVLATCTPMIAATELAHWTYLAPEYPLSHKQGTCMFPMHELSRGFRMASAIPSEPDDLACVRTYLGLHETFRSQLHLPLDRLRQSLDRRSLVDKAVELGIAFEALLIRGETKDQLVTTGKWRAALLHGGTEADRLGVAALYEAFYELRSAAVHTGLINECEAVKVRRLGPLEPAEVLSRAQQLCAGLLRRVVYLGQHPDWKAIFYTPGAQDIALSKTL